MLPAVAVDEVAALPFLVTRPPPARLLTPKLFLADFADANVVPCLAFA